MLRLLLAAVSAGVFAAAQEDALWPVSFGGNAGRTGQVLNPSINGPRLLSSPPYNHVLKVKWRWQFPSGGQSRDAANTFYYGGADSDGFLYYLGTANGGASQPVYKLNPETGEVVWQSLPPPRPYYSNFYGNDHFLLHSNKAAYVIAGTTYTLADCAWVQALDIQSGKQLWWLNGTATVANAALSSDGSKLFLAFANGTVSAIDTATPASGVSPSVLQSWDVSSLFPPGSLPSVSFFMTLAPAAAGKPNDDVLLLSFTGASGNNSFAALVTTADDPSNALLWNFTDPLGGAFSPLFGAPSAGPFVGQFVFGEGNNYLQGQGSAAFDTLTGKQLWSQSTSNIISVGTAISAEQGFLWQLQYLGTGSYSTLSLSSLKDGSQLANPQYFSTFGFASGLSISGDGNCAHIFGSGMIENQSECTILSFCYNGSTLSPEWVVPVTGVRAPSAHYQLVPGPSDGQLSLYHGDGLMVLERYELPNAPTPPADPSRGKHGLIATLVLGKTASDCSYGGGNVTVTPATLVPSPGGSPQWIIGETLSSAVFPVAGTCNAQLSPAAPVDIANGRAWFPFSCSNIVNGQYSNYLAEVDLSGSSGGKPVVKGICSSRSGFGSLFFDSTVNATSPWFLDADAEFTRYFYALSVPPLSSWNPSTDNMPYCTFTAIGQLRGAPLVPSVSSFGSDGNGHLLVASSSDFGMRVITITAPGGTAVSDVTLPCDTSVCISAGGTQFVGVTQDKEATVVVGGSAPYFGDWPSSAGTLAFALLEGSSNVTFSGLVSKQFPTFPLQQASNSVGFLADPSSPASDVSWLQSLNTGPLACTSSTTSASLQSVALTGGATGRDAGNFATLAVNATVPACPLPSSSGFLCFSIAVAHVQAFTSVVAGSSD